MRKMSFLCASVALGVTMLFASSSKAELVTFVTVGTFDSGDNPNSSAYQDAANGIDIKFVPSANNNVDVPPTSLASFGQFDTSATTATSFAGVSSGFTLEIFQTGPAFGTLTFTGTLSGSLKATNSQAFVQFDSPLTGLIPDGLGNFVTYTIVSADSGTPGRVNIAPPSTNNGLSTIAGQVGLIPEPSSFVLLGLGAPLLLVYRARRNRVAAAA